MPVSGSDGGRGGYRDADHIWLGPLQDVIGRAIRTWERFGQLIDALRRRIAIRTRLRAGIARITERMRGVERFSGTWDRAGALLAQLALDRPVTIIILVSGGMERLERCLASVSRNTRRRNVEVLVIGHPGTDPAAGDVLDRMSELDGVVVHQDERMTDQTRAVERGLTESRGDVVLLDGDTEVPPRWLDNLLCAAYQDPRIATVTPLEAGAPSSAGRGGGPPTHLEPDEIGRLVARVGRRRYPAVTPRGAPPVFIKGAALRPSAASGLSASGRSPGVGEPVPIWDPDQGWEHILDDATYVSGGRSSSAHPVFLPTGGAEHNVRAEVGRDVAEAFGVASRHHVKPKPRILYVLHGMTGGTSQTAVDLMRAVSHDYEPFLLTSDTRSLSLARLDASQVREVTRWQLRSAVRPDDFHREDYREIVLTLLVEYAIELVHVRHLIGHTFDLPGVAKTLDIPVVLSFHDYYYSCPTVHLLDEQLRFCGGRCTAGQGECHIATPWLEGLPHLKHGWVHVWRSEVERMFADVDAFVTASTAAVDVYERSFPRLIRRQIRMIEHGRDLPSHPSRVRAAPRRHERGSGEGKIKIAVPGNLDVHKGSRFIRRLAEVDEAQRLEFHFFGRPDPALTGVGVQHGTYQREDLVPALHELQPDLVGLFSISAETYSHTLTEAWAAGIPVVATDLGAFRERINEYGGGWLVDPRDAEAAYGEIVRVVQDVDEYQRIRSSISTENLPDTRDMALGYTSLYHDLLADRTVGRGAGFRVDERLRAGLVVPGPGGPFVPSTHVRVLRRFGHPGLRDGIDARVTSADECTGGRAPDLDVVVVQRTGVRPEELEPFLRWCADQGVGLIFDLDDDLLALVEQRPHDPDYGPYAETLPRLVGRADLVTVSTDVLCERLEGDAERVVAVRNHLDEHLWFQHESERPEAERGDPSVFRLLYMGSPTHADDLQLLRSAMRELSGRGVRLDVVGVTVDRSWARWWRRVTLPDGVSAYPAFVQWLRRERGRWDAAVAPLRDTAFNRAKSDLKFLEYAALGLPGIYSDLQPYTTVEHGVTGLKVPNDTGAWVEAIAALRSDRSMGAAIAERARSYVKEQRCLGSGDHLVEYERLVRSVVASS